MVLSSPKRFGSLFHWQPPRSRKITPSRRGLASARGRPVLAGGSSFLMIGAIRSYSLSGTRQIVGSGLASLRFLPIRSSSETRFYEWSSGKTGFEIAF
jgi:hypothetical protein